MDATTITAVAISSLFFITIILFILISIDKESRIDRKKKDNDAWRIGGNRGNHPAWSWVVFSGLFAICAALIGGIAIGLTSGGHGHDASAHSESTDSHSKAKSKLSILKQIQLDDVVQAKQHFHEDHTETVDPSTLGKQPVCYFCHGNLPHKRQRMIRTLLNMHTQFVGCMTCHLEGVPEEDISLRWFNMSGIVPKGKPFGLSFNAKTGALEETDDFYSRITAFATIDGNEEMMEIPEDDNIAQEFIKIRDQLDPEEMGKVKSLFHKGVGAKGRFCTRCHRTKDSYIPFKKLGFSEQRTADLTGSNIVGLTQKYKEFFIPTIFQDGTSKEKREEKLGKEEKPVRVKAKQLKDPKSWWMNNYQKAK